MAECVIHMKQDHLTYYVEAFAEDVVKEWDEALYQNGAVSPIRTFKRLRAGIPLPNVSIDMREVAAVDQVPK